MFRSLNVLGQPLSPCSHDPKTGWYRDGCCNSDANDRGLHVVCAQVTADFLSYLQNAGNDLVTPAPEYGFPGLVPGDQWCVVATSWLQAAHAGRACPVAPWAATPPLTACILTSAKLAFTSGVR